MVQKCSFCQNEARELVTIFEHELMLCPKHAKKITHFFKVKKDMETDNVFDMREMEKLTKLNPSLVQCPKCSSPLKVHHWEKKGKKNVPLFRCTSEKCSFSG